MFTRTKTESTLDDEIARQVALLETAPDAGRYDAVMDRIERLHKMKNAEMRTSSSVSPDVLITAATHILGISMIIKHEHLGVITSKAIGFVPKLR